MSLYNTFHIIYADRRYVQQQLGGEIGELRGCWVFLGGCVSRGVFGIVSVFSLWVAIVRAVEHLT